MSAGGPGRREIARRVFAVEFDESTHSYRSGEEERAPIYVVSPTGALINRLFVVGVLTESTWVNEETVRARIADPTGSFVVYAGQYQQEARSQLADLEDPAFVAVTGKANVFEPEGGDRIWTSIRPEAVAEVDPETRDRWVVNTADRTLDRIGRLAAAMRGDGPEDEGINRAREAYDPTESYLAALYDRCVAALEVVAGERDEVDTDRLQPDVGGEPSITLAALAELTDAAETTTPTTGATEPTDDTDHQTVTPADVGADPSGGTERQEQPAAPDGDDDEVAPAPASDDDTDVAEPESGLEASAEPVSQESDAAEPAPDAPPADREPEPADEGLEDVTAPDDVEVLDPEEREAVESEFGTDFSTGDEIPEPDEPSEEPATPDPELDDEPEPPSEPEPEADGDADELVDVVMDTMADLDDGTGVPRDELIAAVTDRADVSAEEADDAITDALMDGRCYEPTEDVMQPI